MVALFNVIPWFVWSIVANVTIAVIEYLNRTGGYEHFGQAFLRTGSLIFVAQIGLFYAWRDAPSFMFAWVVFNGGNVLLRLVSAHFFVGERLSLSVAFGVAFVVLGGHLVRQGIGASN